MQLRKMKEQMHRDLCSKAAQIILRLQSSECGTKNISQLSTLSAHKSPQIPAAHLEASGLLNKGIGCMRASGCQIVQSLENLQEKH